MRRLYSFVICLVLQSMCPLFGTIIETSHFSEIKRYAAPSTLIVLDIDDTLLIPKQTLGTDVWFSHRLEKRQNEGESFSQALEKSLAEWEAVRHLTEVEIVEEGTENVIKNLQDKNIFVMGLTTQGLALATRTCQQLKSLDIDLTLTAPSLENHYFINFCQGVLFRQGILFTSGSPKGAALLTLLGKIGFQPERVVFINDKEKHLTDVEEALKETEIDFIGLRYSYSDPRVEAFDPALADFQWNCSSFAHILSDEEAKKRMLEPEEACLR